MPDFWDKEIGDRLRADAERLMKTANSPGIDEQTQDYIRGAAHILNAKAEGLWPAPIASKIRGWWTLSADLASGHRPHIVIAVDTGYLRPELIVAGEARVWLSEAPALARALHKFARHPIAKGD